MSKTYRVAIVGATGAVGVEFLRCLEQRRFPLSELRLFASVRSAGKALAFRGSALPVRELMWGMPGSMVAAVHMAAMTGQARWRGLFEVQAARLLAELEDTPQGRLWTQDLYGQRDRFLGPVHGFAGNVIPLLLGWSWLTPAQQAALREVSDVLLDHLLPIVSSRDEANAGRLQMARARLGQVDRC